MKECSMEEMLFMRFNAEDVIVDRKYRFYISDTYDRKRGVTGCILYS